MSGFDAVMSNAPRIRALGHIRKTSAKTVSNEVTDVTAIDLTIRALDSGRNKVVRPPAAN
jgi:hypothetical protein